MEDNLQKPIANVSTLMKQKSGDGKVWLQAYDGSGMHFGVFDGEYLYDLKNVPLLRVDDGGVYTAGIRADHVGYFQGDTARDLQGHVLFVAKE